MLDNSYTYNINTLAFPVQAYCYIDINMKLIASMATNSSGLINVVSM